MGEKAERGYAKGSKEGFTLGKRKAGLWRSTFPWRTSKRGKHTLKLGIQRMEVNTRENRAERSPSVLGNI